MKTAVFRDPVHGIIQFEGDDAALLPLLETRAMQRLRRVRQVGFASLVYPGAEHSRFGHALGAYHVAGRVVRTLGLPPEQAQLVKVAALIHDVGHGPFSHAWEEALGGAGHEHWGRRIVGEDPEMQAALESVGRGTARGLGEMFDKHYEPRYVRKLVSSQLDVDRMDYLLRDAHYTGVRYSEYDLDWVLHALAVRPVPGGGQDLVIDYTRGMHAVEQYLSGRFYMYAQVYYHKTVRAAEAMFVALMRRFGELSGVGLAPTGLDVAARLASGEHVSVSDYLWLDDARVLSAMEDWRRTPSDPVLAELAGRLLDRKLFKTLEAGEDPDIEERLRPELQAAAQKTLGHKASYFWTIDNAKRLGYDPRPGEEIFVIGHPRHGTIDMGRLLQDGPTGKKSFTVRVLCSPDLRPVFAPIVARHVGAAASP